MKELTWCEECEEFKTDVMYRSCPFSEDVFDIIQMKNMCGECHKDAFHDI